MARRPAPGRPFGLLTLFLLGSLFAPTALAQSEVNERDEEDPYDTGDDWADIQGIAIGDYWRFRVSGNAEGDVYNEVVARGNFTGHFNDPWEVYRIDSFTRLDTEQGPSSNANDIKVPVTLEIDAQKWVRVTDYAVVEVRANVTVEDARETRSVIAYDPPLVEDVYPYSFDFRWEAQVQRYRQQGGEEPEKMNFESTGTVEGREIVEVPAGKFLAWRVRHDITDDQLIIRWYSEEACDLVKEDVYSTTTNELTSRIELTAYACSHTPIQSPTYSAAEVRLLAGEPRRVDPDTGEITEGPAIDPPQKANDSPGAGAALLLVSVLALLGTMRRRHA